MVNKISASLAQALVGVQDGATVNLGKGMLTLVGNHLPAGREVILHSENLAMAARPADGRRRWPCSMH